MSAAIIASSASFSYAADAYKEPPEGMNGGELESDPQNPFKSGEGMERHNNETAISYSSWDLEALLAWAKQRGMLFAPETLLNLPFESEDAKKAFLEKYGEGEWYLLDIVSSNPYADFSEELQDAVVAPEDSAAYLVADAAGESYSLIALSKDGHSFKVHVESVSADKLMAATIVNFKEAKAYSPIIPESPTEELPELPSEDNPAGDENEIEEKPGGDEAAESESPTDELEAEEPLAEEAPAESEDLAAEAEEPESAEGAESWRSADDLEDEAPPSEEISSEPEEGAVEAEAQESAEPEEPGRFESEALESAAPTPYASEEPSYFEEPGLEADEEHPSEPDNDSSIIENIASAVLGLFAATAYGAELDYSVSSPQALDVATPPALEAVEEDAGTFEEISEALEENVIMDRSTGAFLDFDLGNGRGGVDVAILEIAPRRILRSVQGGTLQNPSNTASLNPKLVYFPVNFYDYEGTALSSQVVSDQGDYEREVFLYDVSTDNFNTPEFKAELKESFPNGVLERRYMYNGNPLSSYFLFNSLYMPRFINTVNMTDSSGQILARQNVDFDLSGNTVAYNDGITLGIARNTLEPGQGLKLNFLTMNNLKLFPTLNYPNEKEIFIYGDDTSGDSLDKSSNGIQYYSEQTHLPSSMITAYPNYSFPFIFEGGYYQFDSEKEHVHIDTSVNADKKLVIHANGSAAGGHDQVSFSENVEPETGFFPFNSRDGISNVNDLNYNFGMSMERDFMIPALDAGSVQGDKAGRVGGDPMIFQFSGDDDVWVYIDGKLALDLGGTHKKAYGLINYTTGEVRIGWPDVWADSADNAILEAQAIYEIEDYEKGTAINASLTDLDATETGPGTGFYNVTYLYKNLYDDITAGGVGIDILDSTAVHTFSLFYLERSPRSSNCKIIFNVPMDLFILKETHGYDDDQSFNFQVVIKEATDDDNSITVTPAATKGVKTKIEIPPDEFAVGTALKIQVTETSGPASGGTTVYRSTLPTSGQDPPNNQLVSPWYDAVYGYTGIIYCLNYLPDPVDVSKKDYEHPDVAIEGITFGLYKKGSDGAFTIEAADFETSNDGEFELNTDEIALFPDSLYKLVELRDENTSKYEVLPDIYFETTAGLSPRIKRVYQLDGDEGEISLPDPLEDITLNSIEGLFAFASEEGDLLNIYNKKKTASITVEKVIENYSPDHYYKGDPIFLLKVEQKATSDGSVLNSWIKAVRFSSVADTQSVDFDHLEPGFFYTVSELKSIRYRTNSVTVSSESQGNQGSVNGVSKTATIDLTRKTAYEYTGLNDYKVTFTNEEIFGGYMSDTDNAANLFSYPAEEITPEAPKVVKVRFWNNSLGGTFVKEIEVVEGQSVIVPSSISNQDMNLTVRAIIDSSESQEIIDYYSKDFRPLEPIVIYDNESHTRDIIYNNPKDQSADDQGGTANPTVLPVYVYQAVGQSGSTVHLVGHIEYVRPGGKIELPGNASAYILPDSASRPYLVPYGVEDFATLNNDGTVGMMVDNQPVTDFDNYALHYVTGVLSTEVNQVDDKVTLTYDELKTHENGGAGYAMVFYKLPQQLTVYVYEVVDKDGTEIQLQGRIENLAGENLTLEDAESAYILPSSASRPYLYANKGDDPSTSALVYNGWLTMKVNNSPTENFGNFAMSYVSTPSTKADSPESIAFSDLEANKNINNEVIVLYRKEPELKVHVYELADKDGKSIKLDGHPVVLEQGNSLTLTDAYSTFILPKEATRPYLFNGGDSEAKLVYSGWLDMKVNNVDTTDFDNFAQYYLGTTNPSDEATSPTSISYNALKANANSDNEVIVFYRKQFVTVYMYELMSQDGRAMTFDQPRKVFVPYGSGLAIDGSIAKAFLQKDTNFSPLGSLSFPIPDSYVYADFDYYAGGDNGDLYYGSSSIPYNELASCSNSDDECFIYYRSNDLAYFLIYEAGQADNPSWSSVRPNNKGVAWKVEAGDSITYGLNVADAYLLNETDIYLEMAVRPVSNGGWNSDGYINQGQNGLDEWMLNNGYLKSNYSNYYTNSSITIQFDEYDPMERPVILYKRIP
jgi:hypothetical protein